MRGKGIQASNNDLLISHCISWILMTVPLPPVNFMASFEFLAKNELRSNDWLNFLRLWMQWIVNFWNPFHHFQDCPSLSFKISPWLNPQEKLIMKQRGHVFHCFFHFFIELFCINFLPKSPPATEIDTENHCAISHADKSNVKITNEREGIEEIF